jgi:hypothetical protein
MIDDDKALVERLRSRAKWLEPELDVLDENEVLAAADRIEAQAAEIERLREALGIAIVLVAAELPYAPMLPHLRAALAGKAGK